MATSKLLECGHFTRVCHEEVWIWVILGAWKTSGLGYGREGNALAALRAVHKFDA
jgi:hypothetical protein